MQAPRRLVFTHIAKAAGSSVNGFLHFPMVECAASTLAFSGAMTVYADPTLPIRLIREHGLTLDEFQIILGHIPFATASNCFEPAVFATVLRDPRWQLISNYCSQPCNAALPDFGMSDFIAQIESNPHAEWAIANSQVRMLCDEPKFQETAREDMLASAMRNLKESYAIVGFAEHLEEFLRALSKVFVMDADIPAFAPLNTTGPYHRFVTEDDLAFAERHNALDIRLYACARNELSTIPCAASIAAQCQGRPYRKLSLGPGVFEVNLVDDGHGGRG